MALRGAAGGRGAGYATAADDDRGDRAPRYYYDRDATQILLEGYRTPPEVTKSRL
eukprot:SAG31_NODE_2811_length_5052_cov_3.554613_6_plen_55_part_00